MTVSRSVAAPPQRTEALVPTETEARIAALERRIAIVERESMLAKRRLDLEQDRRLQAMEGQAAWRWAAPAATVVGSVVSAAVAVYGFGVVHRYSVVRQRRDELFKRIQDCLSLVEAAQRAAFEIWSRAVGSDDAKSVPLMKANVDAIARRLRLLRRVEPGLDVVEAFVDFKIKATLDVESAKRSPDPERAERIVQLAQVLSDRLLDRYDETFGKP